jgi:hypothetical protein
LDDIFKALSAQAFTGDLTSAWREHHLPELQREAAERDARLAQKTRRPAALPVVMRPEPKTIEHEEPRYAVLRALSDTQRQVLDAARLQEGAFTPGQLMGALDGLSLARARETLRAFAAIGLIEPITMAKYPDGRDSGAAFVEAYRVAGRPAGPREE